MNLLKATVTGFFADRCTTMSAALAYYTVFALPPMLYLLLSILTVGLSLVYVEETAQREAQSILESQASQMLGNESASSVVSRILESNQQSGGKLWKSLLSLAGIVVGATGVVAAIQDSLNRVWSVDLSNESTWWALLTKRLLSLGMILGLGFLLLVSLLVSTVLQAMGDRITAWIGMEQTIAMAINYGVQGLVTTVIFAAMFKFMPDTKTRWRDVLAGGLITTILFMVGRAALQFYLSYSEPAARLGSAAASLAVILVWVYYSSMIFFVGAEFTKSLGANERSAAVA